MLMRFMQCLVFNFAFYGMFMECSWGVGLFRNNQLLFRFHKKNLLECLRVSIAEAKQTCVTKTVEFKERKTFT